MELSIATSNKNKIREVQSILNRPVSQVNVDLSEVQAIEVEDVIRQKATEAYNKVGKPVLVEDTGLYIHAWKGLPGALIRWFMKTVDNPGICKMLSPFDDRKATAKTCIGYFDGEQFLVFTGQIDGEIVENPQGNMGFGWDPIFKPNDWDKTFAEMTAEEKDAISMRKKAVEALREYLDKQES